MNYRFAVDKSLGSLAKWLRILGFDTVYESDISAAEFGHQIDEGRVLITRTTKMQMAFMGCDQVFIYIEILEYPSTLHNLEDAAPDDLLGI